MKDIKKLEEKWQEEWEESGLFQTEVDESKEKYFATFPYPYINCSAHVGHAYSAVRNDMMIRFYKMLGYNTLFPIGFHATGEPIVGAAKRLKKGDESQYRAFELSGVPEDEIESFKEPEHIVEYFVKEWKNDFKDFGLAVDWRRTFHTTSLNPEYSKFITWQFKNLKEKGYLVKGTHPVIYCPECESVCGSHDRKEGENATLEEYVLLKFKHGDEYLIAATLRPETVFGQTNLWVNPEIEYARIRVGDETWVVSEPAYEKLKWQKDDVKRIGTVKGKEFLGDTVTPPIMEEEIIILPSAHCKPSVGTGIVTSVPSDAPYDYVALKELQESRELCEEYDLNYERVKSIEPIPIIESEELGSSAGVKVVDDMNIQSLDEVEKLEEATKHVYKVGFHKGRMKEGIEEFGGKRVRSVKERVTEEMKEKGEASKLYEPSEEVICRCLTKCYVKVLKDQWFIKYSDEEWKEETLECLEGMSVYPDEARHVIKNMIENMKDKACARKSGLGTRLFCDPEKKIECLSDSTIYMTYYIIQKYIHEGSIELENLTDSFFNYVVLNEGEVSEVSEDSNLSEELLKQVRKELDYFYPVDLRNTAKDLLTNHIIFFLYNHVAFFEKEYLPRAIGANGWVTVNGEKMSKSKGNFVSLRKAINEYGADATRISLLDTGQGISDADFKTESAEKFHNKLNGLLSQVEETLESRGGEEDVLDEWLKSKIQKRIKRTKECMKKLLNRAALKESFHGLLNDINYYTSRKKRVNKKTMHYAWSVFSRLNVPFTPHACEEVNELLGVEEFVHELNYPEYNEDLVSEEAEDKVEFIKALTYDTRKIIELVGKEPEVIKYYVAEGWKFKLFKEFKKAYESKKESDELIKHFMQKEEYKKRGEEVVKLINTLVKDVSKVPDNIRSEESEVKIIKDAGSSLEDEFNAEVKVLKSSESSDEKRKSALPNKVGIKIE